MRRIYHLHDDDQKIDKRTGRLKPYTLQPGYKGAMALKKCLPDVILVKPSELPRTIKPDGADLVEWLQCDTPENIINHIRNKENWYESKNRNRASISNTEKHKRSEKNKNEQKTIEPTTAGKNTVLEGNISTNGNLWHSGSEGNNKNVIRDGKKSQGHPFPFEILGTDENGDSWFTDMGENLIKFRCEQLGQSKLQRLADMSFWEMNYTKGNDRFGKATIDYVEAINDINHVALNKRFNPENIRGVGAFRNEDDSICYNDGEKIHGEKDESKFYIKKEKIDIGIESEKADKELLNKISNCVKKMEFGQGADFIRALSWSSTAAFGGALIKRPILYISGLSGSGKNELLDLVIRPISEPYEFLGDKVTEPGIRRMVGYNSKPITINEFEKKKGANGKNREDHRDAIWDAARGAYDNNNEIGVKAEGSTGYTISRQNNSFCFTAIDPIIDGEANKNRSVACSMKIRETDKRKRLERWELVEDELNELLTKENCKKIRSLSWSKLEAINKNTKKVKKLIQNQTGLSARDSERESIILTTWMIMWLGIDEIIDTPIIRKIIKDYFDASNIETNQNDAENMLEILLDKNKIEVDGDDRKENLTIREALETVHGTKDSKGTNREGCRKALISNGIRYTNYTSSSTQNKYGKEDYLIFVAYNHQSIMKLMETGGDYHRYLQDTKYCKYKETPTRSFGSKSRRVVILSGLLDDESEQEEKLFKE